MELNELLQTSIINSDIFSSILIVGLIMFNQIISKKSFTNDTEILDKIKLLDTNFTKEINKLQKTDIMLITKIENLEKQVDKHGEIIEEIKGEIKR